MKSPLRRPGYELPFDKGKKEKNEGAALTRNRVIQEAKGRYIEKLGMAQDEKMEKDGLIRFICEEEKRKIYQITELGTEVLNIEFRRIERLYRNMKEMG